MSRTRRNSGARDGKTCTPACIIFTTDGAKVRYDTWFCDGSWDCAPEHKRRVKQRTHQMFRRNERQRRYEDG